MKILISNDDGIDSPGILLLAEAMREVGEVTVVAPHRERSTAGHSLTLHKPLRVFERGPGMFATTGTPADCIYLATREILKVKPDFILSGINRGANLGTDVFYSGTVAAAREGALMGIPSYAFSMVDSPHDLSKMPRETAMRFEVGAQVALEVFLNTHKNKFPAHTLLNVNIPNVERDKIKKFTVTRQGLRYYANEVAKRQDPRGRDYFWIGGAYAGFEKTDHSDCDALERGEVSISPLAIDCTHREFYEVLSKSV